MDVKKKMEAVLDKKTFSDLKFVRITGEPDIVDMLFRQIPRELFEQVKDIEFNIDLLYQYPSKFIGGVNNMFYVLVDDEDLIKGILWIYINVLTEAIQIQILSIDKEYQFGNALKETEKFIRSWLGENENLKIQIMTTRPHAYQKNGWKKSKQVLMEI
ncbi:hypothetical protein LCGC14_0600560 [marine sediment metagenome]|uniref:N-acetyltransferase domain-containing protein n=1 Tax=marine sediment metagenome TaxID=412755 RepID=A0A0F9RAS8_9ZZZZ